MKRLDILYVKTFKNTCEPSVFESMSCYSTGIFCISCGSRDPQEKPEDSTKEKERRNARGERGHVVNCETSGLEVGSSVCKAFRKMEPNLLGLCPPGGLPWPQDRASHGSFHLLSQFGTEVPRPSWSHDNSGEVFSARVCPDRLLAKRFLLKAPSIFETLP